MTAQGTPRTRFDRAVRTDSLLLAETAVREMPWVPLDVALQLVRMFGEAGDKRYEGAVRRWMIRWLEEEKPSLEEVAATACSFVEAR